MGLLDKFIKKEKKSEVENKTNNTPKPYEIKYSITKDGRLQIDFYDKDTKLGQLYDTTRLVVGNKPLVLANQSVQNCLVSWYRQDDVVFFDSQYENESLDARNYKGVLAQVEPRMLEDNEEYCATVMKKLLDQKRVNKYLEDGLQETPEHACGKYIGGVQKVEDGYKKFFSIQVGEASHYSELMINRRREYKESMEIKRQKMINEKKAEIQKLQSEIDEMSR